MAIGRTFREAIQKGLRSLEIGLAGFDPWTGNEDIETALGRAGPGAAPGRRRGAAPGHRRSSAVAGSTCDRAVVHRTRSSMILPRGDIASHSLARDAARVPAATRRRRVSRTPDRCPRRRGEAEVRTTRRTLGIRPVYHRIDTCAGEFESYTPYLYSTYETAGRGEAHDAPQGPDPGRRTDPHRPGNRVRRLRLRGGGRLAGGGHRVDPDELQSRDGLDRLRHVGPALLRAADPRGRSRGGRSGEARRGDPPVRRPDAALSSPVRSRRRAFRFWGPPPTPSILPKTGCASDASPRSSRSPFPSTGSPARARM